MAGQSLRDLVDEFLLDDETVCLPDGFDAAFLGLGFGATLPERVAVYDYGKCLDILVERDGMTLEEAEEFFSFNVVGSIVHSSMPIFVDRRLCDQ